MWGLPSGWIFQPDGSPLMFRELLFLQGSVPLMFCELLFLQALCL